MFDRFSTGVRLIFGRCSRIGVGLDEGWRRIGEGLDEDGPLKYGLGAPPYGDLCADLLKNAFFLKKGSKSRKTFFYVFSLFTSLFRRFTLSGIVLVKELDEINRSVSKNRHFMPSGSVF